MRRAVFTNLIPVVLSGCMVGPDYVRPSAPSPSRFKEAQSEGADSGWKIAAPRDSMVRWKWWELYGDPQLNALEEQVDSANQSLKVAEAHLTAARAAVGLARAEQVPTITAAPGVSDVRTSANSPYFPSVLANNGDHKYSLPLDLSYEIDLWGRVRRTVNASKDELQATAADLETARLSLHAEVAVDYIELRNADAQHRLLDDTVRAYQQALTLTENRFQGGAAPKTDVAQARTQLETVRVLDTDIVIQRAQYEHALAMLVGKPPANFSIAETPLNVGSPTLPTIPLAIPTELLERRPDVASAERRMAAANERIGIAQATYYPTLTLGAVAGFESTSSTTWFNWPSRFWAAGPTLSETLFDGGRRKATKSLAVADYDAAVASYRQTVLTSFQQVEDDLTMLRVLSIEMDQQHHATGAAEDSLRLFKNRYVVGVDTYLQVVTSQTTVLANQRNDLEILKRQLEASVLLHKALGGGWDTSKQQ